MLGTLTGEIEKYRKLLSTAREELEPWEKHIIECEGKIGVTSSASRLLKDKVSTNLVSYLRVHLQIFSIIVALPPIYSFDCMKTLVNVGQFRRMRVYK